jgi:hypothetical protein
LKSFLPYFFLDCFGLMTWLLPFKASELHSAENCFDITRAAALRAHFRPSWWWNKTAYGLCSLKWNSSKWLEQIMLVILYQMHL